MEPRLTSARMWQVDPTAVIYPPIMVTKEDRIHIGAHTRIDAFVKLEGGLGLVIGNRVHIASFCHVNVGGGDVIINDQATLSSSVKIVAGGHTVDSFTCSRTAPEDEQKIEPGCVVIHRNACIFTNAVIVCKGKQTLIIGEGARVGAGSVVLDSIPDYEVWAGNPARRIGVSQRGGQ